MKKKTGCACDRKLAAKLIDCLLARLPIRSYRDSFYVVSNESKVRHRGHWCSHICYKHVAKLSKPTNDIFFCFVLFLFILINYCLFQPVEVWRTNPLATMKSKAQSARNPVKDTDCSAAYRWAGLAVPTFFAVEGCLRHGCQVWVAHQGKGSSSSTLANQKGEDHFKRIVFNRCLQELIKHWLKRPWWPRTLL